MPTIKQVREADTNVMTDSQVSEYLKKARKSFNDSVRRIKKAGVFSYALDKYMESGGGLREPKPIEDMTYNQKKKEFVRLQKFLKAETSTLTGIKKVNLEQDLRIFGSSNGKPLGTMTEEQRKMYWRYYDSFMDNSGQVHAYQSNKVQQFLASASVQSEDDLNINRISKLIKRFEAQNATIGSYEEFSQKYTNYVYNSGDDEDEEDY